MFELVRKIHKLGSGQRGRAGGSILNYTITDGSHMLFKGPGDIFAGMMWPPQREIVLPSQQQRLQHRIAFDPIEVKKADPQGFQEQKWAQSLVLV